MRDPMARGYLIIGGSMLVSFATNYYIMVELGLWGILVVIPVCVFLGLFPSKALKKWTWKHAKEFYG